MNEMSAGVELTRELVGFDTIKPPGDQVDEYCEVGRIEECVAAFVATGRRYLG